MKYEIMLMAGILTIIAICVFVLIVSQSYVCTAKAEKQGYECEWSLLEGCMVKVEGKWVDYDKWRIME